MTPTLRCPVICRFAFMASKNSWHRKIQGIEKSKASPRPDASSGYLACLLSHFAAEAGGVDYEAFMGARRDAFDAVMRLHVENQLAALDSFQTHRDGYGQAGRGGGLVREIHVGAERLFGGPVKMRAQGFDARPFEQADHEAGSQHVRHFAKHVRFRKKVRHRLVCRNPELECMGEAGFQGVLHGLQSDWMVNGENGRLQNFLCAP